MVLWQLPNSCIKGRSLESLAAQNLFLAEWESGVADTRIHATTRQQVVKVFHERERARLLPLPAGLFPVFEEAPRMVHGDGYDKYTARSSASAFGLHTRV